MSSLRKLGSVIYSQQIEHDVLQEIMRTAEEMEKSRNLSDLLAGKIMVNLFYEPSTRTRMSFESAMMRLGGRVIGTENAKEFSSKAKGETLEDSVRVVSGYGDIIVLRYHKKGGAERAQNFSSIPIINAGDGEGEHPTQALLDLYTIRKEFDDIRDLRIAMMGDLENGRTVRSLCYLLAKHYPENEILFVSPELVRIGDDIKQYLDRKGVNWKEYKSIEDILPYVDIFYQTRVQFERERFTNNPEELEIVTREAERIHISDDQLYKMTDQAIIMHPLPRKTEIGYGVDRDRRARYFAQAQNGVYVRMALLKMILVGY